MPARKEVWIGLVEVAPKRGSDFLGGAKGAYVNVLASAKSSTEYRFKVRSAVNELRLKLLDIENPEPLSERLTKWTVDEEILTMAETVKRIDSVTFGTFHVYEDEEE